MNVDLAPATNFYGLKIDEEVNSLSYQTLEPIQGMRSEQKGEVNLACIREPARPLTSLQASLLPTMLAGRDLEGQSKESSFVLIELLGSGPGQSQPSLLSWIGTLVARFPGRPAILSARHCKSLLEPNRIQVSSTMC